MQEGKLCACGTAIGFRSRGCRACHLREKRARGVVRYTCPDCGGVKDGKARRCRACDAKITITLSRDGGVVCHCGAAKQIDSHQCITCRRAAAAARTACACGSTKLPRAKMCRRCYSDPQRLRAHDRERSKFAGVPHEHHEAVMRRIKSGTTPCAICGEAARHLDHDHASGAFRGMLCANCNKALGLLKDDPLRLERAAAYLRAPPGAAAYADDWLHVPEGRAGLMLSMPGA